MSCLVRSSLLVLQEIGNLKKDNDSLRAENQRLRDAHKSGGQSFTALRDHFGQLQRINKNLMKSVPTPPSMPDLK
jgi:hypothetical protein